MKKYNSVFELAAELDAQGFERDKNIFIPADSEDGCLHCEDGSLYEYPEYTTYHIDPKG
jgi:hypothetical protein